MLKKVKLALRISSDSFDDELEDLIEAAKEDLFAGGVSDTALDSDSALISRAIVTYAKAHYGLANPDSDKYYESYQNMREKLALSGRHNKEK